MSSHPKSLRSGWKCEVERFKATKGRRLAFGFEDGEASGVSGGSGDRKGKAAEGGATAHALQALKDGERVGVGAAACLGERGWKVKARKQRNGGWTVGLGG